MLGDAQSVRRSNNQIHNGIALTGENFFLYKTSEAIPITKAQSKS
jgi:hypothetical protein